MGPLRQPSRKASPQLTIQVMTVCTNVVTATSPARLFGKDVNKLVFVSYASAAYIRLARRPLMVAAIAVETTTPAAT